MVGLLSMSRKYGMTLFTMMTCLKPYATPARNNLKID